jgi:hypothetical protein
MTGAARKHISMLLIMVTCFPLGCAVPTLKVAPPPISQDQPSNPVVRLHTEIFGGPSGTVDNGTVTFRWASTLSSIDPLTLTYATFLQGYEQEYTTFLPDTSRTFRNLPNGGYTFYVKGHNPEGQIEPTPASRSFTVAVPPPKPAPVIPPVSAGSVGGTLVGGNINRLAVGSDGQTIYAVDSMNGALYRSDNAGMGWTNLSNKIGGGPPWVDFAIAPDDPRFVAVVTDGGREVYVSADGGATPFSATGLSAGIIPGHAARCIAVSAGYGAPKREMAVGTWNGAAGGRVLINVISAFPSGWFDAGAPTADISAIEYSPSFPSDGALLLVASTAAKTFLYMGLRDLGSFAAAWNGNAGYPVELGVAGTGSSGTPLNYADISLPADYSSACDSCPIYASWSRNHPGQDVYVVVSAQAYRLRAPEAIASIAFYGPMGRGRLLAGAAKCTGGGGCFQVQTYFTPGPSVNGASWQPSLKAPTGSRDARVAWSADGKMAYAATSGTESAVSHSRDNGRTWNQ